MINFIWVEFFELNNILYIYSILQATENQVGKKKILDAVFPDLKTDKTGVATYKGVALTAGSGKCVAEGGLADAQVS